MATVVVDAGAFAEGRLPPVCAITGGPADGTMSLRAQPPQPFIVLVLGGLLAFLFAGSLQSRLDGEVPVAGAVHDRLAGRLAVGRVCLLGALTCTVAAVVAWRMAVGTGASAGLWVAAVVAAGAAAWLVRVGGPRWWSGRRLVVHASLHRDVRWVELRRVHPDFVRAVEAEQAHQA
jgi:hypothetical protein